jgi:hypothetical protein
MDVNKNDFDLYYKKQNQIMIVSQNHSHALENDFKLKNIALLISNQIISSLPNTADRFIVLLASFHKIIIIIIIP